MKKKKVLFLSIIAVIFVFGAITGLIASLASKSVSAADYGESSNEPVFYDVAPSSRYQNCDEDYYNGDLVTGNFRYGGSSIVKLQSNAKRSTTINNTQVYYVTEDTFTLKLKNIYSVENEKELNNGYYMSNDSQKSVLGRKFDTEISNGVIFIETAHMNPVLSPNTAYMYPVACFYAYNSVLEPLKGEPFKNAGNAFNSQVGLYTLSGNQLHQGVRMRIIFCYELFTKKTFDGFLGIKDRNHYRFKEIYEFYVVKDTNNIQIVSEDEVQEDNGQNLTDDDKLIQEFGTTLGNNSTVNKGFSLQLRTRELKNSIYDGYEYDKNLVSLSNFYGVKYYKATILNPKTITNDVLVANDLVNYSRIKIEHRYKNGTKNLLLDYNSTLNSDFTYSYGENNVVNIGYIEKTINNETKETAKYAKLTFNAIGKHEFIITSASGKTKSIVIYVYDKETNGDGYGLYFDKNIFEGEQVNYLSTIPTFRNSVKIEVKAVDSELYPKLFIKEYLDGAEEPKIYSVSQNGYTLSFTKPGNYVLIATNGDINSGGSFYQYTIKFNIDNRIYPPQVNKKIISEMVDFSMIDCEVYEIKFKTKSGYYAKIIFGLEDYDLALDYAYELEKLEIDSHASQGYYIYNSKRYEDVVKLTDELRKNAENKVQKVKFDYGFKCDESIKSVLDYGADIRTLELKQDTYVMTASAYDNLFTEDIILKGDFQFTKTADYDSKTIVAKHMETGKMTNILHGKPLKEQLDDNGLYLIMETNCYNETISYTINYYNSCALTVNYKNGVKNAKNFTATESILFEKFELDCGLNLYIRLTDKSTKKETFYTLEEFKNITLGVGEYEIYCAVQFGGTCIYNVVVKEKINPPTTPSKPNNPVNPTPTPNPKPNPTPSPITISPEPEIEDPKDDKNLFEKVVDKVGNFVDGVASKINDVCGIVGGAIDGAVDTVGGAIDGAVDTVKDFFKRLF